VGPVGEVRRDITYAWASDRHIGRAAAQAGSFRTRRSEVPFLMLLYGGPALSLDSFATTSQISLLERASSDCSARPVRFDKLPTSHEPLSFKPEVGISKTLGPLTWSSPLECVSTLTITTFSMQNPPISPLYSAQGHLIYSFTPGIWAGLDALYFTGGARPSTGKRGKVSGTRAWALLDLAG